MLNIYFHSIALTTILSKVVNSDKLNAMFVASKCSFCYIEHFFQWNSTNMLTM